MTRRPRTLRPIAIASAVGLLVGLPGTPAAQAHPSGEPQTAEISSTAIGLRIVWTAAPDDLGLLASWIGVTDGTGSLTVFEDGALVPEKSTELPGTQLAKAPQFSAYLLERIEVTSEKGPCTGVLLPVEDVEADGATIDFDCGAPVASADVRLATLTDIDEAYLVFAVGPRGQTHTYSDDAGVVRWTLGDGQATSTAGADAPSGATAFAAVDRREQSLLQLGAIGVGLAAAAAGGMVITRRRRSRSEEPDLRSQPT